MLALTFYSCSNKDSEKKKVVYVNSYHRGFPPSDQITRGVTENLSPDSIELYAFFMDTKRNPEESYIVNRAEEIRDSILRIKPDILIVSDDNALKYLALPYFKESPFPIVFCGINWSIEQYDLRGYTVTGVLEILPIAELVEMLKPYYPEMRKLLVLNENTTTSRKTKPILDTLLASRGMAVTQELVDNFEQWKSVFAEANQVYDIIYLQTRGAIKGWDHDEALKLIDEQLKIPLITCEEFMMPYAVVGLTQLSEEQGRKAAEICRLILNGKTAGEIPVVRNNQSQVWLNTRLADKIRFTPDTSLVKQALTIK